MLALLCMVGAAYAQSASDRADALFQRGKQLMSERRYAEACAAFDDSQKLDPSPATVVNQANCRERNGQLATAKALYLEAARQTGAMREPKWKKTHATANARAATLGPRLSTLRIDVPPGHVVEGLEVLRDGAIVEPASFGQALPIDGGTYRISARAPDRVTWTETVSLAIEGEARVVEVPKLVELPRMPEPSLAHSDASPTPAAAPARPAGPLGSMTREGSPWTGRRKVAIGLAAAGVAALGAGTVLGIQSNRKRDQTDALCPDPGVACADADRANALSASASHLGIGADVAFGLAAGAGAAAVILWMTGAAEARSVAIAPAASPGQFMITASQSW